MTQIKNFIILFLLALFSLFADSVTFTLEHAITREELKWGLMGRDEIPENHGLLLHFPKKGRHGVWMFNCRFPLSVAFLREDGKIVEIHSLQAYPEMMPKNPIQSPKDLETLDFEDPVVQFFISKSKVASTPIKYALEMPMGWFQKKGINVGDIVMWDLNSKQASVIPAFPLRILPIKRESM